MSSAIKDVFDGAHEKIGVSTLLPDDAAALLVRAADKARTLPIGSLARAKCLAEATSKVRFVYPWLFRSEEEASSSVGAQKLGLCNCEDEGCCQ